MPGATASCLGTIRSTPAILQRRNCKAEFPQLRENTVPLETQELKHHYTAAKCLLGIACSSLSLRMAGNKSGQVEICLDNTTSWFACFCRTLPACLMTGKQNPLHESYIYIAQTDSNPFPGKGGTLITNLASRGPSVHVAQQSVYSVVLQTMNYTIQELDEVLMRSSNLPPPP